ncbi:MAG: acyltransferase [Alphaproteobacteria bacterium]|nr:acyltransferase [Alphaproteobacteria bacterium]
MTDSFYSENELRNLGLKSFGNNVLISRKCSIYNAHEIVLGNNVRIDDFSLLSGNISIGNYVHISAYGALYRKAGIKIGNFCGMSPRSTIFSASDDFNGDFMISPMVPSDLVHLKTGPVEMMNYSQLGTNTVVMPSVTIKEGAVCGAYSLVLKDCEEWTVNFGIPCRFYKNRSRKCKELSEQNNLT